MLLNPPVIQSYADNELPLASSVAPNTEVYNTTYQVKMMSNGTRWIPLASFIAYSAVLADSVTGTTSTTTLREVELPFKYIGKNGQVRYSLASDNTNNANGKVMRALLTDGTTTTTLYDSTVTTVPGRTIEKSIFSAGSEYNFYSSNSAALANSSGNAPIYQQFAPTDSLKLRINATLGNSADTITLTRLSIQILPGF